jgi:hypothetical protein
LEPPGKLAAIGCLEGSFPSIWLDNRALAFAAEGRLGLSWRFLLLLAVPVGLVITGGVLFLTIEVMDLAEGSERPP